MYEMASDSDNKILEKLLATDRYEILNSYDIHVALFVKYGKRDKEGNLKSPALTKNGIAIPAQVKLVSNFNRITDDTDVKIVLNAELWQELSTKEKTSTLDNMLAYIQIKEDKDGEPLPISESCDKVQLKLKHPDFYCEGFLDMLNFYKKDYLPWQDAANIAEKVDDSDEDSEESEPQEEEKVVEKTTTKSRKKKETEKEPEEELDNSDADSSEDTVTPDGTTLDIIDDVLNN